MNKNAEYHYHEERWYKNLIGKSLFDCHSNEKNLLKGYKKVMSQLNVMEKRFLYV